MQHEFRGIDGSAKLRDCFLARHVPTREIIELPTQFKLRHYVTAEDPQRVLLLGGYLTGYIVENT
jgi:hypothetical protein